MNGFRMVYFRIFSGITSNVYLLTVFYLMMVLELVEQLPDTGLSDERFNLECQYPCKCGSSTKFCKGGKSTIKDGCHCCLMCPRQQGDRCSYREKCDEGLICDMNDTLSPGICKAQDAEPCEVNGNLYKDHEEFNLDCRRRCTCQNGILSCVSNCPHEEHRPSNLHCANLQLIEIQGQCCREWVCPIHPQNTINPRDYNHTPPTSVPLKTPCVIEETSWSTCSVTCGLGESVKQTNDNSQCTPETQMRLCYVRPCPTRNHQHKDTDLETENKKCKATHRAKKKLTIDFEGCVFTSQTPVKYCSMCPNRCCRVQDSRTIDIQLTCKGGEKKTRKFMQINRCSCQSRCI